MLKLFRNDETFAAWGLVLD